MHTIQIEGDPLDLFDHLFEIGLVDEAGLTEDRLTLTNGTYINVAECTDGLVVVRSEPAQHTLRRLAVTAGGLVRLTMQRSIDFATFLRDYASNQLNETGNALFGDIEVAPWQGQRRDVRGVLPC